MNGQTRGKSRMRIGVWFFYLPPHKFICIQTNPHTQKTHTWHKTMEFGRRLRDCKPKGFRLQEQIERKYRPQVPNIHFQHCTSGELHFQHTFPTAGNEPAHAHFILQQLKKHRDSTKNSWMYAQSRLWVDSVKPLILNPLHPWHWRSFLWALSHVIIKCTDRQELHVEGDLQCVFSIYRNAWPFAILPWRLCVLQSAYPDNLHMTEDHGLP